MVAQEGIRGTEYDRSTKHRNEINKLMHAIDA
jgi:hypothetical protein